MTQNQPWYRQLERLTERVAEMRASFDGRCEELEINPNSAIRDFTLNLIPRIVNESTWQEGLCLSIGRTRELVDFVSAQFEESEGARLDVMRFISSHVSSINEMLHDHATVEEVATVCLARAHQLLPLISMELCRRSNASLMAALDSFRSLVAENPMIAESHPSGRNVIERSLAVLDGFTSDSSPPPHFVNSRFASIGEYWKKLIEEPFETLTHPMHEKYLHLLHIISMHGTSQCEIGGWRKSQVTVDNPDLVFPPPSVVPSLMMEYCKQFPSLMSDAVHLDPIDAAARQSYALVRVHPYADGNGRLSRLIINLFMVGLHPPISVCSKSKGRHRYRVALRRADRGNLDPMRCLIAIGICDSYTQMLNALGEGWRPKDLEKSGE